MTTRIIVIDDDKITLELVKHILDEIDGGQIKTFSSSIDAMKYIQTQSIVNIDLVVCDWHMPDFSGFDILHAFRLKSQIKPFLMITADATKDTVVKAIREGASDFIAKPFKNSDFSEKVQRLLETK